MNKSNQGYIFNIQRFSIHDGPGIRTVVFFKGCFLHCLWCCNPESQNSEPEIGIYSSICQLCLKCLNDCPNQAISIKNNKIFIDRTKCVKCGRCVRNCSVHALKMIGETKSVTEIIAEIKKDEIFYKESNGGITLSGGEPLLQTEFLLNLLCNIKQIGYHTAIETSGYLTDRDQLKEVSKLTDLFLFDIKLLESETHKKFTGIENEIILDNLKYLIDKKNTIILRCPTIEGINNDIKHFTEIVNLLEKIDNNKVISEIHVLPYHRYGVDKYEVIGKQYDLKEVKELADEEVDPIRKYLVSKGFRVKIGG
jgi:pyruvate formate lyase activating enzyme